MKTIKKFLVLFTMAAALLSLFASCDNMVGLGSRINTNVPIITTPDDVEVQPGGFLNGNENILEFLVEQEHGIDRVYVTVRYIDRDGVSQTVIIDSPREYLGYDGFWIEYEGGDLWLVNITTENMRDGDVRVWVTAIDIYGNVTTTIDLVYVVLNTPPRLELTLPEGLSDTIEADARGVTGTVSFIGSLSARVVRVYYALGETETAFVENRDRYDNTGWTNTLLHTNSPLIGHIRPGETLFDLGPMQVNWAGTLLTSFNWRFHNIADIVNDYYVVPRTPGAIYGDPDYNLWELPIKFRLVDAAGNVAIETIRVLVDPDADLPVTTIVSHYHEQIVGGPIRISGNAEDNEVVHTVFMRIFKQTDDEIQIGLPPAFADPPIQDWIDIAQGYGNSFISWTALINEDLSLHPPTGFDRRLVRVDFRSLDAHLSTPLVPKDFGRIASVILVFDNTAPVIDSPQIFHGSPSDIGLAALEDLGNIGEPFNFIEGSLISGSATLRVIVRAPAGLQTIRVRSGNLNIDLKDGVTRTFNDELPWLSSRRLHGVDGDEYTLFIPLNTNTPLGTPQFGNGFQNAAAFFSLEIHLADNTTPSPFFAQSNYNLRVDNRNPLGRFTGKLNVIDPLYTITGDAWDHGSGVSVHGIRRLAIFFSRPGSVNDGFGTPVNLAGVQSAGAWVNNQQRAMVDHLGTTTIITQQGEMRTLPFFPDNFGSPLAGGTGIDLSLDNIGNLTVSGGFNGGLGAGPVHNWFISDFDFSNFADGPLVIHYVIFDHAGNATHYYENIFLAINRPIIQTVYLGVNLGAGIDFEPRAVLLDPMPIDSYFRIRNHNFHLRLDVRDPYDNPIAGTLNYDVAHVTRRSPTPIPASQMVAGGVYRVADRGTATGPNAVDWLDYGVLYDLVNQQPALGGNVISPVGITFVATRNGSAANNGTVYAYDIPEAGPRRRQGTWNNSTTTITFDGTSFAGPNATRPIPDSTKVMQPDGVNFELQNDRFFVVRVTDSIGITNTALVRVDVHNDDTVPPVIRIADFGRSVIGNIDGTPIPNFADRNIEYLPLTAEGYNMNIVMSQQGARRGYVQYYWDGETPRADISGRVIFRGTAADNNRLTGMTVSIDGGAAIPVATWQTNALVREGVSVGSMGNDNSTAAWGFDVSDQANTQEFGHVLNWEFGWDSSTLPGVVRSDVPITFTVTDGVNPPVSQTIRVNVVPYITEIVTPLTSAFAWNPSAFNRSARGWYPVRENDEITIRGFNLGGPGSTTTVSLPAALTGTTRQYLVTSTITQASIAANIGLSAVSGDLLVTVNPTSANPPITSINNRNNNSAHYNMEPNNYNNNILTDNRYLYVWQTGFLLNEPQLATPVMRMQPDGTWFLSYGLFGTGNIGTGTQNANTVRVIRSPGNGAAITDTIVRSIGIGNNRFNNVVLASDGVDWFVGSSNIDSSGGVLQNFVIAARDSAGALTSGAGGNNQGNNHRNLIRLGHAGAGDITRIVTPSLFAQNTTPSGNIRGTEAHPTRVLVSYFDTIGNNNALFFRYGLIGGATTETAGWGGNFPNSATFNTTSHLFPPAIPGPASTPPLPASSPQVVASNLTTHQGSNHVAVGALSNGLPVIAWFDRANQTLVFSHGQNAPSTYSLAEGATSISNNTTQVWQNNARVIHNGGGTHVSMAIDGNDVIHLAFQDLLNGGGLFYARIYPTAIGTAPDMNGIHVARVDAHPMAGTRGTINVRRETHNLPVFGVRTFYVPYISYFHNAFSDTRNPIRVAWLRPDAQGNMSVRPGVFGHEAAPDFPDGSFNGEWEIMTVPANRLPFSGELVSIGVPETGSFHAPTNSGGNLPQHRSNLARVDSFAATAETLRRSVLIGYRTVNYFEGAVLKYNIWQ